MAIGNGNGSGNWLGPRLATSHETTKFKIGGQDIEVPALNLFVMDKVKDSLLSLGPNLDWISYAVNVVHIIYEALKGAHPEMQVSEEDLLKACSLAEMREFPNLVNQLLEISGFEATSPETPAVGQEAGMESPNGTGTSPASSPNLQSTESAAETPN
jgi:hypothetical protein